MKSIFLNEKYLFKWKVSFSDEKYLNFESMFTSGSRIFLELADSELEEPEDKYYLTFFGKFKGIVYRAGHSRHHSRHCKKAMHIVVSGIFVLDDLLLADLTKICWKIPTFKSWGSVFIFQSKDKSLTLIRVACQPTLEEWLVGILIPTCWAIVSEKGESSRSG